MRKPATQRKTQDSVVRIASVMSIPDIIRSLGADPHEVLAELGYDLKLFADPETRVSYPLRNRILGHCAARTGCPHFGLLVGQHNGLHTFGLVGLAHEIRAGR